MSLCTDTSYIQLSNTPLPHPFLPSSPPLLHLPLRLLGCSLQIALQLLALLLSKFRGPISASDGLVAVVAVDAANLCRADAEQQRVDGSQDRVLRLDHKAPPRPDGAGAHEREVLRQRERLGGPCKIGGACGDHGPFHYWRPGIMLV
jgi:hypothetical protein